jgi:predicted Fe-S protein YdhL (DUF1289 family)
VIQQKTTESPCISHCIIDADTGFCEGCWRTLVEISAWRTATEQDKIKILDSISNRQQS